MVEVMMPSQVPMPVTGYIMIRVFLIPFFHKDHLYPEVTFDKMLRNFGELCISDKHLSNCSADTNYDVFTHKRTHLLRKNSE